MVLGIGCDILSVSRFEPLMNNFDDPFFAKTFTRREIEGIKDHENPLVYLTDRFAAKEAVFKAIGRGANEIRLNQIEIITDENGRPKIELHDKAYEIAKAIGISRWSLSLSNETGYAFAVAVCE